MEERVFFGFLSEAHPICPFFFAQPVCSADDPHLSPGIVNVEKVTSNSLSLETFIFIRNHAILTDGKDSINRPHSEATKNLPIGTIESTSFHGEKSGKGV